MNVSSSQLLSLLSTVLKVLGTAVVAHGTLGINGAMWEQISGGILMLAPVVYDMFRHTDAAQLKAVEAMPDVKKIVVAANAGDGVGAALADPTRPKVVTA